MTKQQGRAGGRRLQLQAPAARGRLGLLRRCWPLHCSRGGGGGGGGTGRGGGGRGGGGGIRAEKRRREEN